jgi:uncharacterized YigZ family protein
MLPDDFYYTIDAPLRAPDLKVKGSRFIAEIAPVQTKEAVEHYLTGIRKEFHDATHHCFAYRLGADALQIRAADDGEPTGTAGKPILLVLTARKLTDVLLVVTRYFGGTKLGTGGLARAYAEAAQQAVSMASVVRIYLTTGVSVEVHYEDVPSMERLVHAFGGQIEESTYLESVTFRVAIRNSKVQEFLRAITEKFQGRIVPRS